MIAGERLIRRGEGGSRVGVVDSVAICLGRS